MSGIALLYRRDGAPASREAAAKMLETLVHRGPDTTRLMISGGLALGCQHFWTTPEEVGEQQPISDETGRFTLAFDGRLDNRKELSREIGLPAAVAGISDAEMTLRAYALWGEECFQHLLGSFAIVVYDSQERKVVCARDPLGDRTLFYCLRDRLLVVASEEQAVTAHPAVSSDLDERGMAYYFALGVADDGTTLFRDVKELAADHLMVVDSDGVRFRRYWLPRPQTEWERAGGWECAKRFRELLDMSVQCRLRSVGRPAVLMSGGLDSTSVAALAAAQIPVEPGSSGLRTISWYFDELEECDERRWIGQTIASCGLDPLWVRGDDLWPLSPHGEWPLNPNAPSSNAFRALKQRAYRAASEAGSRVLLTGVFGDELYAGSDEWLGDLVAGGQVGEAFREIRGYARVGGLATAVLPATRRLVARSLPGALLRRRKRPPIPEWLLPRSVSMLDWPPTSPAMSLEVRRYDQYLSLLSPLAARDCSGETFFASLAGVDLRHPYRDRRLVEFMLSVPATQLNHLGWSKYVLRNAMSGVLPEPVRQRTHHTDLTALYVRGAVEREAETVRALVGRRGAAWRRLVRPGWVESVVKPCLRPPVTARDHAAHVALWHCLSFEQWDLAASTNDRTSEAVCACRGPLLEAPV